VRSVRLEDCASPLYSRGTVLLAAINAVYREGIMKRRHFNHSQCSCACGTRTVGYRCITFSIHMNGRIRRDYDAGVMELMNVDVCPKGTAHFKPIAVPY